MNFIDIENIQKNFLSPQITAYAKEVKHKTKTSSVLKRKIVRLKTDKKVFYFRYTLGYDPIHTVLYEKFIHINHNNKPLNKVNHTYAFLKGLNIKCLPVPNGLYDLNSSNYNGLAPYLFSLYSDVINVYQPGVSSWKFKGVYNEKTEKKQWQAMLKLTKNKNITPITHSLATIAGLKNLTIKNKRILPEIIISPMVSMRDALTKPSGSHLTLWGLPSFYLCSYSRWLPILGPYPLASEKHHLPYTVERLYEKKNSAWQGSNLYYLPSSKYLLKQKGLEIAKKIKNKIYAKPLGIVTKFDRIFSPKGQEKILNEINAKIYHHETGHRWGTEPQKLIPLLETITNFTKQHIA